MKQVSIPRTTCCASLVLALMLWVPQPSLAAPLMFTWSEVPIEQGDD